MNEKMVDEIIFRRFLITGKERNFYTPLSHNQSILMQNDDTYRIKLEIGGKLQNVEINSLMNLNKTAEGKKRALKIIKEVYIEGTYIHKEYIFYSLAKLIHGNAPKKTYNIYQDARNFVLEICPKNAVHDLKKFYVFLKEEAERRVTESQKEDDGSRLFHRKMLNYRSGLSAPGCAGRGIRRIIALWYNKQNPYEVTFSKNKAYYSHRNIIRKSHIRGNDVEHDAMLTYLTKGLNATEKKYSGNAGLLPLIEMYKLKERIKNSQDLQEILGLIRTHKICDLQLIPTSCQKNPKVWSTLLTMMPMSEAYCNLKLMASRALITNDEDEVTIKLVANLTDIPALIHSKIQPAMILIALRNCQKKWKPPPRDKKTKSSVIVCDTVLNAIEQMIQPSFDNLPKLQKSRNICIQIDVRTKMQEKASCWRNSNVKCLDATAITLLSILNSANDSINQIMICCVINENGKKQLKQLDLTPSMMIKDVKKVIKEADDSGVAILDISMPILSSFETNKKYDTFMFISGTHTYCNKEKLYDSLVHYRSSINMNTKFMMVVFGCDHGNVEKKFSVANEDDHLMLDIAGFDGNIPKLIIKYINEEF